MLDGLGYIESSNSTVSNSTDISLAFKTKAQSGIIIGVGDPSSFLVLELVGDRIRVSVKLKTGELDICQ